MAARWNRLTTGMKITIVVGALATLLVVLVGAMWSALNAHTVAGALGVTPSATIAAAPLPTPKPASDPEPASTPDETEPDDETTPPITAEEAVQAEDAALAALWAVVAQPAGESSEARTARLTPYFEAGSPTSGAEPAVPGVDGVVDLQVEPLAVQWTEPYDPADGRLGLIVSIQTRASGLVDNGATAWQDTSTQLWRITLVRDAAGSWTPDAAYPADVSEPAN